MWDSVRKEYVKHFAERVRNYLNEPSYYPVYKTFKIEDQRALAKYLETKIERKPDGTPEWTQPTLTQPILRDLKLEEEVLKGGLNIPTSMTTLKWRSKERDNQHPPHKYQVANSRKPFPDLLTNF
jgi:phage terminase small subunit